MSRRHHLWGYLLSRLALVPVMLWLIASLVFLLLRVAPGDPIDALLGPRAPQAAREALRQQLGLDQSLPVQYGQYLNDLLHGQLGTSLTKCVRYPECTSARLRIFHAPARSGLPSRGLMRAVPYGKGYRAARVEAAQSCPALHQIAVDGPVRSHSSPER